MLNKQHWDRLVELAGRAIEAQKTIDEVIAKMNASKQPGLGLTNRLWAVHIDGQVPTVIENIIAPTPEAAVSQALHKVLTLLKMEAERIVEDKKNDQV